MRKRIKIVDRILQGDEPLDEQEQAELVDLMFAEVVQI